MKRIRIKKILCPLDFSACSDYALRYALGMANEFGAELKLLHVVELPFLPSYSLGGVPDLSAPMEAIEQGARQRMEQLVEQCRAEHEDVDATVRTGTPFLEIVSYAEEIGADLIVAGSHGRSGLRHMLIGSVAEKLVRKAPCPVLTVKNPEECFEKEEEARDEG